MSIDEQAVARGLHARVQVLLEERTVARDAAGVTVSPILALDMTRPLANVDLSGAPSSRVGTAYRHRARLAELVDLPPS